MKKKHPKTPKIAKLGPPVDAPPLAPSVSVAQRRLDLACGKSPKEGFEGVDIWNGPGVTHVVNLARYPWPFEDDSVDEIYCSHYVEHITDTFVMPDGSPVHPGDPHFDHAVAKDAWFKFFEEMWRIMKPGAIATILCPAARHHRAFQDPTHRRFIVSETFSYLSAQWRRDMSLDHYNTHVNFVGRVDFGTMTDFHTRHPSMQAKLLTEAWNVIADWQATMQKQPRFDLPPATLAP